MRFLHNPFTDKLDISGVGPGGTVTEFITGNSGGPVPSDASYNINVLGDNASGIDTVGTPGTSTLTIFGLAATTSQVGTQRNATNLEASAQSSTSVTLTPSNITSMFSVNPLPSSQGGTGLSSPAANSLIVTNGSSPFTVLGVATNGQIPIGSIGSAPVLANITSLDSSVTITNGPGTIDLSAGGSVAITFDADSGTATPSSNIINFLGTSAQGISSSASGNSVTYTVANATSISKGVASFNATNFTATAGDITSNAITVTSGNNITATASWNLGGAVSIAVSGTTNHALQIGNASGSLTSLGVATNGQLPIGSTGADPVLATLTAGTGISITNGAGSITIATNGSSTVNTLTGNTGGAISPSAGNINTVGTGSITIAGSGNTLTTQLTGLTNHNVLVGADTATITNVAPSVTTGVPLISNGSSADPSFGTAVVAGGGTGSTSFTTYGPVVAASTSTGALTSVAPSATSGIPFISQGSSANPAFGTAVVAGGGTGATTFTAHSLLVGQGTSAITALGAATNGQLPIGSTGNDPVLATLTAGSGISITNAAGSITIASTAQAATWNLITTNQTLAVNNGYVVTSGTLSLALPTTSAVGDIIELTLDGGTSWTLTQSSGQQIRFGNVQTTSGAGGSLASTAAGDTIRIVCTVANTRWNVLSCIGNITVV